MLKSNPRDVLQALDMEFGSKRYAAVCRPVEPYAKKYSRYVVQLNHMQKNIQGMSSN